MENKENIVASMASFPPRKDFLQKSVQSLLPQVDKLNIYLNEYEKIPEFLSREGKVNAILSKDALGDLKDNGKFFFLKDVPDDSFYLTVDDDIEYPENYVSTLIEKCTFFDNQYLIGVHGVIFHRDFSSFHNTRTNFYFENELEKDIFTSILGTGTIAFYKKTLRDLSLDDFKTAGMADIWLSIYCKKNGIPLLCISRKEKWLKSLIDPLDNSAYSLWNQSSTDETAQNKLIREYELWNLREDGIWSYRDYLEKNLLKNFFHPLEKTDELESRLLNPENSSEAILNSKSFELGNLFFRSIKDPLKILTFPINFFRIIFSKKRSGSNTENTHFCTICNKRSYFKEFGDPPRKSALCPNCDSLERHRLLHYMYKMTFLGQRDDTKILHMAPEKCFAKIFSKNPRLDYTAIDLDPSQYSFTNCQKEDFTNLSFNDKQFDIILSNHILEHIEDEKKALSEMRRCLKDDGMIIVSIPMDDGREITFEDPSKKTDEERRSAFGQKDHVRIYGKDITKRFEKSGYIINKVDSDIFPEDFVRINALPRKKTTTTITDGFFMLRKKLN